MKRNLLLISLLLTITFLFAQKKAPDNWQTLDPKKDKVFGVGSEEAYKALGAKTSKTVVVAVIDCGVDPNHEDLKNIIWTNPGEIPDNGIDDDKNGYVDDVHGWSFLGGKSGDIGSEATELARLVRIGNAKYATADETKMNEGELKAYNEYKKMKESFVKEQKKLENRVKFMNNYFSYFDNVKKQNNGIFNKEAIEKYTPASEAEKSLDKRMKKAASSKDFKPEEMLAQVTGAKEKYNETYRLNLLNTDSIRQLIVGDNVNDPYERFYGNNHIQGPDASHGTHVAGIIAAIRNNNLGIKGIADNVKIMVLRAVPVDGDERDKDVANAIRYAADNGATIVNMSFGKAYSPDKKVVDDAVKYAEAKDVLLLQAAGNDAKDNDIELPFPNREYADGGMAANYILVGASGYKNGKEIVGSFSNYGQKEVDFFAPGVNVYSSIPDNKYESMSGTSMASPSAAGVAALIRGYFPELKAPEVRTALMKTVYTTGKKVNVPGMTEQTGSKKNKTVAVTKPVSEICISGGFVNAGFAVKELLGRNNPQ